MGGASTFTSTSSSGAGGPSAPLPRDLRTVEGMDCACCLCAQLRVACFACPLFPRMPWSLGPIFLLHGQRSGFIPELACYVSNTLSGFTPEFARYDSAICADHWQCHS